MKKIIKRLWLWVGVRMGFILIEDQRTEWRLWQ